MSHPWNSMFEIFIAKYVPYLDEIPNDAYLVTICN
jgi:hypothetical protein